MSIMLSQLQLKKINGRTPYQLWISSAYRIGLDAIKYASSCSSVIIPKLKGTSKTDCVSDFNYLFIVLCSKLKIKNYTITIEEQKRYSKNSYRASLAVSTVS